jgi:dipeptide/tripeptide permease
MTGTGLLFLTALEPTTGYSSFWYWLLLIGLGNGLIMSPMTTAIMGTVPAARAGMASATSNTMRQVGSVLGIAVLGNVVTRTFTSDLGTALASFHLPASVQAAIVAFLTVRYTAPHHVEAREREAAEAEEAAAASLVAPTEGAS